MKNANPNIYLQNKIVIKLLMIVADVAHVVACLLRNLKVGGSNFILYTSILSFFILSVVLHSYTRDLLGSSR